MNNARLLEVKEMEIQWKQAQALPPIWLRFQKNILNYFLE